MVVLDLCDQRRQLKQQKYTSTDAGQEYRKLDREVRKKMKAAKEEKEEWIKGQHKDIEVGLMSGSSKEAYNTFKALTKTQQRKSAAIKDSSGSILTESTAVLNLWTEYCSGLDNCELHLDTSLL